MKRSMAASTAALILLLTALAARAQVASVSPADAYAKAKAGAAQIVDVREAAEVEQGMAAPAVWYPSSKIQADPAAFEAFLAKLPKGEIVFYCAAGGRAGKAAATAAAHGYTSANMGGYDAWAKAGLPTRKP